MKPESQGLKFPFPAKVGKVDQKRTGVHHRPERTQEQHRCLSRSARGHKIVHQEDLLAFFDTVLVQLEGGME